MDRELGKVISKHYKGQSWRKYIERPDYIEMAHKKCAPYISQMVEAIRKIPDIPEKKGLMSSAIEFSRATERHIANLEFEMTSLEYFISKLFERNRILEEEVKRCHAKIDITDDVTLSMIKILERKLRC